MKKKIRESDEKDSMKDLELFYSRKKEEQEALKNLLKALDERSIKEKSDKSEK